MINQMTIIGLGLIGRSIAKAINKTAFTKSIVCYDEDENNATQLINEQIIDHYRQDLVSAIKNSDLIVMTEPFEEYENLFEILADNIKPSTTITDVACIKLPILELAKRKLGEHFVRFVPSHPIISFEKNHPLIIPEIFADRPIIITPIEETSHKSINLVSQFWQKMGGQVETKSAAENDSILACISHLPQILAITFLNSLNDGNQSLRYLTKNVIDFTNITSQSSLAWSDVCVANRVAILKEIAKFESNLKKFKKLLESENTDVLLAHINNTKATRENI